MEYNGSAWYGKNALAQLHFIFRDKKQTIVDEPMSDGIHDYENAHHVMTDNPSFVFHRHQMDNYLNLKQSSSTVWGRAHRVCRGMLYAGVHSMWRMDLSTVKMLR